MNLATRGLKVPRLIYLYDATSNESPPVFLGGIQVAGSDRTALQQIKMSRIPRSYGTHFYERNFEIADRKWAIAVVSDADEYKPDLAFVIAGTGVLLACIILVVLWIHTSFNRGARMNKLRIEADEEKALIAQRQVLAEKQLNEYMAHEGKLFALDDDNLGMTEISAAFAFVPQIAVCHLFFPFVTTISVRNPLSAAISAINFVKTEALAIVPLGQKREEMLKDIEIADSSLQYINELLRNMLDVHKSAGKRIKLDLGPTDVEHDILQPVASILFVRSVQAQVKIECPADLFVNSDRMRLKQIILNLALNATKFVERGFILLGAAVVNGKVEISVRDSGPGIPESKRHRLFEQYQESLDSLNQGTGIGLSVCKKLCDLLSADIALDNSYDSGVPDCPGACFVVRLNQPPLEDGEILRNVKDRNLGSVGGGETSAVELHVQSLDAAPANVPLEANEKEFPENLTCLFVDDDSVLRKMFTRSLERVVPKSWKIEKASNGETALRLVETKSYDLIFMDQYVSLCGGV